MSETKRALKIDWVKVWDSLEEMIIQEDTEGHPDFYKEHRKWVELLVEKQLRRTEKEGQSHNPGNDKYAGTWPHQAHPDLPSFKKEGMFNGVPVYSREDCPKDKMYFINTDYIKPQPAEESELADHILNFYETECLDDAMDIPKLAKSILKTYEIRKRK